MKTPFGRGSASHRKWNSDLECSSLTFFPKVLVGRLGSCAGSRRSAAAASGGDGGEHEQREQWALKNVGELESCISTRPSLFPGGAGASTRIPGSESRNFFLPRESGGGDGIRWLPLL